ncbi:molybdopterin-containing oxidoreductase family protein [Halodesulfurarchaeum sp.]|uniref:molybdopterin-containing oxidoreductase family protein n=1 Tax=Halodesulfurarchaeum sp. TaxID=1980530 RepID=UPI001BBF6859|nr:molybdopterin-dependent oxidoreductase [Halodesulfurarchaeum sp.]
MSKSEQDDGGVRRRTLLKAGGVAAAAGLTGVGVSGISGEAEAQEDNGDGREVVHGNCWICRETCGQEITIEDGKAIDLTGVDGHPKASIGEGTEGTLCSKGMAQLNKTYNPNRIRRPHIKKDGELTAVDWDEAFEYTSNRLEEFAEEHGPEKLLRYKGYPLGKHSWEAEFIHNLFGSAISAGRKTTCHGPFSTSWEWMAGYGREWPDWQNSEYIIAWGRNVMECFRGQAEPKGVLKAKEENDATLVCIDPRYTKTAEVADKWIPIEPRTDGALALAMANVIIEENLYDRDFVSEWTHGFKEYKEAVADKTPEWAAEITDVDADVIREIALGFAKAAPSSVVFPWTGLAYQANGFKNCQNLHALNGLVGSVDTKGGTRQWRKPFSLDHPRAKADAELPSNHSDASTPDYDDYPFQQHGIRDLTHNMVPKATERGDIQGVMMNWSQPPKSGNTRKWWEAMEEMDLVITVDAFWTGVSKRADVVFPGASQLEQTFFKKGGDSAYSTSGWVTGSKPAIEPLGDCKRDYQLYKELSQAMGWGEYFPWEDAQEYFDSKLDGIGLSFDELDEKSYEVIDGLPYRQYEDGGFKTVNGLFNFDLDVKDKYKSLADDLGISTAPSWVPPDDEHFGETTNDEYPLLFTDTMVEQFSRGHCQALSQSLEAYAERFGHEDEDYRGNYLHINPRDAEEHGIEDGDWVAVKSADDEIELMANVWEGVRPGWVCTENGFGEGSSHPDDSGGHSMKFNKEWHMEPTTGMTARNHPVDVERLGGEPQ